MKRLRHLFESAGVLVSTTIGAGFFSLPYLFQKSGWAIGLFYLLLLGVVMGISHRIYWESLEEAGERHLLGLARRRLGRLGFSLATVSVSLGLILALVVYLILGANFVLVLMPGVPWTTALLLFWALAALPFLFGMKRIVAAELLGAIFMGLIIFVIFVLRLFSGSVSEPPPAMVLENALLPFGAVLFSLAGWTAIGPMRDMENKRDRRVSRGRAIFSGTAAVVVLYALFVISVFGVSSSVTPDTLSGLYGLPGWILTLMGVLGIFAIWTSYLPIGLEAQESLEKDFGLKRGSGVLAVTGLPLALVFLGLNDFLKVLGFAGGVFLSLQYLIILYAGEKALRPAGIKKLGYRALMFLFLLGAAYEAHYFFF